MSSSFRNKGFSLTEVLIAAGVLAIGFAFIAGMFPVGVRLTTLATEQTIAPIVVDEATAKIRLYGEMYNASLTDPNLIDELKKAAVAGNGYVDLTHALVGIPDGVPNDPCDPCELDEFAYPSTDIRPEPKKYHWSAICRRLIGGNVHITIFVVRRAGAAAKYRTPNFDYTQGDYGQVPSPLVEADGDWPVPVKVRFKALPGPGKEKMFTIGVEYETFINAGCTIVDDTTAQIYRVMERTAEAEIVLDRDWGGFPSGYVWVIPPAEGSGRNPCIGVYQKVISL
jgi:prepilin-type N-terminal cleavage/methylation domain-containing protein